MEQDTRPRRKRSRKPSGNVYLGQTVLPSRSMFAAVPFRTPQCMQTKTPRSPRLQGNRPHRENREMAMDMPPPSRTVLPSQSMSAQPLLRTHSYTRTTPHHSSRWEDSCLDLPCSPMAPGTPPLYLTAPQLRSTFSRLPSHTPQCTPQNVRSNLSWPGTRPRLGYKQP